MNASCGGSPATRIALAPDGTGAPNGPAEQREAGIGAELPAVIEAVPAVLPAAPLCPAVPAAPPLLAAGAAGAPAFGAEPPAPALTEPAADCPAADIPAFGGAADPAPAAVEPDAGCPAAAPEAPTFDAPDMPSVQLANIHKQLAAATAAAQRSLAGRNTLSCF
ncbi:MAG TPA: hypothetical protein VJV78_45095 [Polyangiales bacterium]|nr:hypothetical protein [Polyangiales bacterium]